MKKITVWIVIIVVALIGGSVIFLSTMNNHGPEFEQVRHLLAPRIVNKAPAKMLVVETTGDPGKTVGPAFGLLFKTYYKLKVKSKMEAPRARWPKPFETPREQWVGIYAIPVPQNLMSPPPVSSKSGLRTELRDWEYGTVAEILHVGPYKSEDTTVVKLKKFIAGQGYEICGDHEEEYLKGPGFGYSNPTKYLTIIRYEVRKKQ